MNPWAAASFLGVILFMALICYFFAIPEDLGKRAIGKVGIWGSPNAEFNWCEQDYLIADWLAEPLNTVSNITTVLSAVFFLYLHESKWDLVVIAILQMTIGFGSVFFHASLRYPMQLVDELPMLWFGLMCFCGYIKRLKGVDFTWPAMIHGLLVALGTLVTEQRTGIHEFFRGVMSLTFALCMVVVGWGSSAIVTRMKQELVDERRHVALAATRIHFVGYVLFVASLICWLLDNYYCTVLSNLPGGLPYPQLHMWWHVLTAAALYIVLVTFQFDDRRSSELLAVKSWMWLPVVHG